VKEIGTLGKTTCRGYKKSLKRKKCVEHMGKLQTHSRYDDTKQCNVVKFHENRLKNGDRYTRFKLPVPVLAEEQKNHVNHWSRTNMWVTWVKCKHIQDMMIFNHVVKFHKNRMKNGEDTSTRLNIIQND
jgi:hypothetical protein